MVRWTAAYGKPAERHSSACGGRPRSRFQYRQRLDGTASQTVVVILNQTVATNGTYVWQTGSLEVTVTPPRRSQAPGH